MARLLGAIVGAVIFAYLWSRLWLWLTKRVGKLSDQAGIYVAYAVAWATAIVIGGYGYADGGPWNGGKALMTYTPALILWLVIDLFARRGQKA